MITKNIKRLFLLISILSGFILTGKTASSQCINSLSTNTIELPGNGGADNVYILYTYGYCESYEAYTSENWINVWTDYSNGIVTISANANYEGFRQGTVVIYDYYWAVHYVTVYQEMGCPPLPAPENIYGPSSVCCNTPVTYYIDPIQGATYYIWYVNGIPVSGYYGTSAEITFSCEPSSNTVLSVRGFNECGTGIAFSRHINVKKSPYGGWISGSQTICYNTSPTSLNNINSASGGVPPYNYQWQYSTDGGLNWNNIPGATSTTFSPSVLTVTTKYRRTVTDASGCQQPPGTSNIISIDVYSPLNGGIVAGDNTTSGYDDYSGPIFSLQDPSGGTGNYSYAWEMSENGDSLWNYTGCNSKEFPSSPQNQTTYYRRKVTDNICGYTAFSNILRKEYITYITYTYGSDPETRVIDTNLQIGSTDGSISVDAAGGATYNISIELPQGVNGLTPSLSLIYSSHGGPGIAGYGWNISGLSSIKRGPQNYYNDGAARGVELDNNDRFYLDGQRLVNTSSNYGNPSAQYQTELDIFTRITPQDSGAYGPEWFKAETKSGLIYEYGNSQESKQQIKINDTWKTLEWYVSKVSDLFGNQITFSYLRDYGIVYPKEIRYGPYKISFYYNKCSYSDSYFFIKSVKLIQSLLLEKIKVQYNSNVIKTYEFKYSLRNSAYDYYSLLSEVIEYGTGNNRLNSTIFSYILPENMQFQQTNYYPDDPYINYKSLMVTGDFNGDSKSDFFCLPTLANWSGMKVCYGNGNDKFIDIWSRALEIDVINLRDIEAIDLNADGKDDIIYEYYINDTSFFDSDTTKFYIMTSNGYSLSVPSVFYFNTDYYTIGISGKKERTIFSRGNNIEFRGTDYNGDGINDIFICNDYGDWIIYSFGDSDGVLHSNIGILASGHISTLSDHIITNDFNGDGKADIWSFETSGLKIYSLSGNSLNLIYSSNFPDKKHHFCPGDFNGDGKFDLFIYGYDLNDWPNWQMLLSRGTSFETKYITQKKANLKDDYIRLGDFNGDGCTDIMASCKSNNITYFYFSKNKGTDLQTSIFQGYTAATDNYYLADFNGDGKTDFICTDKYPSPWWNGYKVYRTSGNSSVLMNKISNGLGVLTKINYARLSEYGSNIYQKGSGAVFPVTDFQGPWNVVSSILTDNGKGSFNTQNYYYEGAKIHLQGKGFLGFAKTRVIDSATGIENGTTSGYNSTYYYPEQLSSYSKLSDTISVVRNTW